MPASHEPFTNLRLIDHPLIQHKLSLARDRRTSSWEFRRLLNQITGLMTFEILRTLPTKSIEVETPLERTGGKVVAKPVTFVPILRAGIAMTDGILALMPEARVGHIGIYREEDTLQPVTYYCKLPGDVAAGPVLLIDPMLATGGSACKAAAMLKERLCTDIRLICLVAAPEGLQRLAAEHPDVIVSAAALDRQLNDKGYILPGLGDAGDRIFGTQ